MAQILYAGRSIALPSTVDLDELESTILDNYANGTFAWLTFDSLNDEEGRVRLLIGPGIAVGITIGRGETEIAKRRDLVLDN
jgi:hypothetical protein